MPRSEGGSDDESNIELVCWQCHKALHVPEARARSNSRVDRKARKTRIKTFKAQLRFDCRPSYQKCKDCEIVCLNYVIELLVIFFQWLDEVTREANRGGTKVGSTA